MPLTVAYCMLKRKGYGTEIQEAVDTTEQLLQL